MSPIPVTVTLYNMHKGMSVLNRKIQLNSMADVLHDLRSDVFFLQEVQGRYQVRSNKIDDFPEQPYYDFLGERLSYNRSYGRNAVYPQRHYGNAILGCLPIETLHNLNITVNRLEQRGVLHCEVLLEGWGISLVRLCAHLSPREPDCTKQYRAISEYVSMYVDPASLLIITGDSNDQHERSALSLGEALNLDEISVDGSGRRPKAFPSRMPFLSFDRMYTRNLEMLDAQAHNNKHWQHLSDHLPLNVKVRPKLKLPRQAV